MQNPLQNAGNGIMGEHASGVPPPKKFPPPPKKFLTRTPMVECLKFYKIYILACCRPSISV